MTNKLKYGWIFASAIALALTASPALAIKKPGWVKKSENAVTGAVTTVANNVSNSQTDKVARAVGYSDFAVAQARGYGDSEILEVAHLEAKANNWSNLAVADTASVAMGFKNYADRMASDSESIGRMEYIKMRNKLENNYGPEL